MNIKMVDIEHMSVDEFEDAAMNSGVEPCSMKDLFLFQVVSMDAFRREIAMEGPIPKNYAQDKVVSRAMESAYKFAAVKACEYTVGGASIKGRSDITEEELSSTRDALRKLVQAGWKIGIVLGRLYLMKPGKGALFVCWFEWVVGSVETLLGLE